MPDMRYPILLEVIVHALSAAGFSLSGDLDSDGARLASSEEGVATAVSVRQLFEPVDGKGRPGGVTE